MITKAKLCCIDGAPNGDEITLAMVHRDGLVTCVECSNPIHYDDLVCLVIHYDETRREEIVVTKDSTAHQAMVQYAHQNDYKIESSSEIKLQTKLR